MATITFQKEKTKEGIIITIKPINNRKESKRLVKKASKRLWRKLSDLLEDEIDPQGITIVRLFH